MNGMTLSEAARLIEARHIGADAVFTAVSSDTRNLENGDLFVALRGHSFDGHEFIGQARERGACAAVVSRDLPASLPLLLVADTRLALGRLAAGWRARTDIPVVAVTGSNGKTTVKEMTAAILARRGQVLATRGNLNNDIGVPLTLLRLRPEHRHAVIEMGANHPGEIAYLTRLAQPTVALITNAGPAHLEGFGDVAGVARAKGEIYGGLRREGVAVINADDAHAGLWRELTRKHRVLTFGLNTAADVTVLQAQDQADTRVRLQTPAGQVDVALPLPGRHNVMNALAATAAALACGAALQDVKQGLESMQPVSGRLQSHAGPHGARNIDDTYNANPAS
ncbi:MAG: UDP-N-acetylmuramoyl-tripeptide--D-alanyl-D-alanine ligase, partial [Gammaproteobacteria bacterium]|nr:UDP-N-acetylmuramoyl-tripeptide--D-alanyl-D-alanine ligase [Gammaproteobacteria bacterium]